MAERYDNSIRISDEVYRRIMDRKERIQADALRMNGATVTVSASNVIRLALDALDKLEREWEKEQAG